MMDIKELREKCQKRKVEKPLPFFYRIHRIWSIYPTYVFIKLGIRPNYITFSSIALGVASLIFISLPTALFFFLGVVLLYLSFLFDKCDGEVARYRGEFSAIGVYLDEWYHFLVFPSVFLAIGYNLFNSIGYSKFLFEGMLVTVIFILIRIDRKLYIGISRKLEGVNIKESHSSFNKLVGSKVLGLPNGILYPDITIYLLVIFYFINLEYYLHIYLVASMYRLLRQILVNLSGKLTSNIVRIRREDLAYKNGQR